MLEAFVQGLVQVVEWPAIGFMVLGVAMGIWLGAVPGLGGIIGLVVLLPFTYGMAPVSAFALLLGMFAVTTTSDTISSIMLGIPGTAASQATILDGYPLAQKGEAQRAFGAAFTVSAFGGVFGALILAVSLPLVLPIVKAIASPELFMLGVLGLAMVGSLAGASVLKGLIVAVFGLLLSTVGYAETLAIPRYTFGAIYLMDGLPLIPVVLGLFALPELVELATKNVNIARISREDARDVSVWTGVRDVWTHRWLALRSAILGTYVGILPGLGASIVDWLAYGHAVQSAKDKSQFGRGDIRGVIAPEAANNATKGGALIPTVAFGIPGSLSSAILLGALLIQGLRPGPDMLTTHLNVTFAMVWTIVIANILAAALLMYWSNFVAKVAFIRGHLIVPAVVAFVFMGAWLTNASDGDWIVCLSAGFIGFIMKRSGWPRPPLVLALVLGSILETSFQISMRIHDGYNWITRPIVMILAAAVVLTLILSFRSTLKSFREGKKDEVGEGGERNPLLSLPLSLALLILASWAYVGAQHWPAVVRQFPVLLSVPAFFATLVVLAVDARQSVTAISQAGGLGSALRVAQEKAVLGPAILFFVYVVVMVAMSGVVGQIAAMVLFIMIYLWRWGGYGWKMVLGYGLSAWIYLYVFYDRIMHVYWKPSMLDGFYAQVVQLLGLPHWLLN